ncbi:MAG: hypothetical protein QNK04_27200 [Myxococcota bacterium]|nr:hypothetical protein [Myxococcota bacterium]
MGGARFGEAFSHQIHPTFDQLLSALCLLVDAVQPDPVRFLLEPIEWDLSFDLAAGGPDQLRVSLVEYRDHRRGSRASAATELASYEGPRSEVVLTFWRALRRLLAEPGSPITTSTMRSLDSKIRELEDARS